MPRFPAALLLCCLALACAEERRSVLLVTLDTTRADALGCLGGAEGLTPHLDALAAEGVRYTRARTVAPLTMPAHASMFTGLYPPRHTVRDNKLRPLPEGAFTVAERLAAAGYRTAAFVSSVAVDRAYGFAQGFEVYDQPPGGGPDGEHTARPAAVTVAAARTWIEERDRGRPFFLWVHLFDPHAPYEPPAELRARAGGDAYLGEVAALDDAVGELVAALRDRDLLDATFVAVVGDHGEALGENGEQTHSALCYDATILVPLILRHPDGRRSGEVSDEVVSVVDVHPTLLAAVGEASPGDVGNVDGIDLFGGRVPEDRGVYFESYFGFLSYGWSPLAGWANAEGVYLHSSRPLFFGAGSTAGEPREVSTGEQSIEDYRRAIAAVAARPALEPGEDVDEEMLAALRGLGYAAVAPVAEEMPHPLDAGDRPSPDERIGEHERTMHVLKLPGRGKRRQAIDRLRTLLDENPDNLVALEFLGACLTDEGRLEEAADAIEALIAKGPRGALAHFNLAMVRLDLGQEARAVAALEHAVEADPRHADSLVHLVRLLDERGEEERADRYAEMLRAAVGR